MHSAANCAWRWRAIAQRFGRAAVTVVTRTGLGSGAVSALRLSEPCVDAILRTFRARLVRLLSHQRYRSPQHEMRDVRGERKYGPSL